MLFWGISCHSSSKKKSILAGFHEASMFNWKIELYIDSTFCYSNGIRIEGTWTELNDSIFLFKKDYSISYGKIINRSYYQASNNDSELKPLTQMKFIEFIPPKVVDFPKK